MYHYVMDCIDKNMHDLGVKKTRDPKIYHLNYNLFHIRTGPFECKWLAKCIRYSILNKHTLFLTKFLKDTNLGFYREEKRVVIEMHVYHIKMQHWTLGSFRILFFSLRFVFLMKYSISSVSSRVHLKLLRHSKKTQRKGLSILTTNL